MSKIKSLADLVKLRDQVKNRVELREDGENSDKLPTIKVAMATCGIAAGAREVMNFIIEELNRTGTKAVVTHTGCMGLCYAEPTIEVTLPGKEPIIYGNVGKEKATEIINEHIIGGELVDGIIPSSYRSY